ncbi:DUF928 domain-containing protein [Altericista sp. CCNU0014]|uniref:DUF928 domain-containing protein n=1 Tax=Altericista sp. CCNU0014 TaxID=3082949 RepID=UPI00384AED86
MKSQNYWFKTAIALTLLGISCPISPSFATRYRPPQTLQRPAGRQGGATRTGCVMKDFVFEPIIPISNYGHSTADYPTIYWYLKNHNYSWARLDLYPTQDSLPEEMPQYSKTWKLTNAPPLYSFTFPQNEDLKPLEVGREYLWKLTLFCSPLGPDDDTADGSQVSIQGAITRVSASSSLSDQLERSDRKYDVYAEEGLWYDAIHDLATRRQERPQDPQLNSDWCDLMKETRLKDNPC